MLSDSAITFKELLELKTIDEQVMQMLKKSFGKRFERALETMEEERVHKYIFEPSNRVVWIVTGTERDYWIIPDIYCNCNDFYMNVVTKSKYDACYHLLAKVISERLENYRTWNLKDDKYLSFMEEWKEL